MRKSTITKKTIVCLLSTTSS